MNYFNNIHRLFDYKVFTYIKTFNKRSQSMWCYELTSETVSVVHVTGGAPVQVHHEHVASDARGAADEAVSHPALHRLSLPHQAGSTVLVQRHTRRQLPA